MCYAHIWVTSEKNWKTPRETLTRKYQPQLYMSQCKDPKAFLFAHVYTFLLGFVILKSALTSFPSFDSHLFSSQSQTNIL